EGVYSALRGAVPADRRGLRNYVKVFLNVHVPDVRVCAGHASPMDYLWHAWHVDIGLRGGAAGAGAGAVNGDAVIWANRGGGKTQLAALATLLDCVFKPRCSVRILGGSLEQSSRMYEYLAEFVHCGFEGLLDGPMRKGQCRFLNGASVEVMTQSAKNVRGRHVRKLRCDEVEHFDEAVFNAAKFITQSSDGIVGAMEAASTVHRPYGLMQRVVDQAAGAGAAVFKWCVFEVIERCRDRVCSRCALWGDCRGRAKEGDGYLKVDDVITQMRRSSRAGFEAEMLCVRPALDNAVFADFDEAVHVGAVDYDANLPLYRAIDFGYVNPFVCLWIQVDEAGRVRVFDEYVQSRATIDVHAAAIRERTPCAEEAVAATYCDPAGGGRNMVTGTSAVKELAGHGIAVQYRASGILHGVELIRRAIRRGDATSHLVISPRCVRLIESLRGYHYPDRPGADELPYKDGLHDHAVDALRYFFVNCEHQIAATKRY
ncbi:MAG: hypothetical protein IH624_05250, partial [Phycisphaerae bacterium]|nr:hypothetical protein [Phycisphaerae bacterium]